MINKISFKTYKVHFQLCAAAHCPPKVVREGYSRSEGPLVGGKDGVYGWEIWEGGLWVEREGIGGVLKCSLYKVQESQKVFFFLHFASCSLIK